MPQAGEEKISAEHFLLALAAQNDGVASHVLGALKDAIQQELFASGSDNQSTLGPEGSTTV